MNEFGRQTEKRSLPNELNNEYAKMNIKNIKTLGDLKASGYQPKSIKEELRRNLICKLQKKEKTFPGIVGYEDSIIPDVEGAVLTKQNIIFLNLRGQAATTMV